MEKEEGRRIKDGTEGLGLGWFPVLFECDRSVYPRQRKCPDSVSSLVFVFLLITTSKVCVL